MRLAIEIFKMSGSRVAFLGANWACRKASRFFLGQNLAAEGKQLPIEVEKANHTFGFLDGLNQPVQKNPIEVPVSGSNAMRVVLEQGVHGASRVVRYSEDYSIHALYG
jgi:hypothetical protein